MAITLIYESLRLVNMRKDPWWDPKSPHRVGAHPHSSSCEHDYCSLWLVVNSVWGKSYSLVWSRCTHILLYGAGKGQGCLLSLEMNQFCATPNIPGWSSPVKIASLLRFLPFPDSASWASLLRATPNHLLPGCPLWTLSIWKPTQRCPASRYHGYAYTCVPIQRSSYFNSISMVDPVSKRRNRNNWSSGNRRKRWHHVLDEPKKCDEPWSAQTSPRKVKFVSLACSQSSRQEYCCQTPSLYYS